MDIDKFIDKFIEVPEQAQDQAQDQHDWQFSFAGIDKGWVGVYVVGFCPVCSNVFSAPIPTGDELKIQFVDVPRFGCRSVWENH